jgi:hypothetical protein
MIVLNEETAILLIAHQESRFFFFLVTVHPKSLLPLKDVFDIAFRDFLKKIKILFYFVSLN